MSLYTRTVARLQTWTRAVVSGLAALRRGRPALGSLWGKVATLPNAEADLGAMATSPTVYAAVLRRAAEFATHPIVVYRGWTMAGGGLVPVTAPWAEALYRLLATPDPESADEIAPEPGEGLIMQIVADLILAGVFVVAPTLGESGAIIGLTRLHPGCCSIERLDGREWLVYRSGADVRRYPRRSVFVGRLLSWQKSGAAEFGVGAGTPLAPLVKAERVALEQTAAKVEQGGADLVVKASNATGKNLLANPETRETILDSLTRAIKGPGGRRVFAHSSDLEISELGIKPSDLQAPELLKAASGGEMMATGTVPAWVGASAGTYANDVMQLRVQAGNDEGIQTVIEAFLLRPLARHFARRAGGMDARRYDQITARIDLSQHPGYAQLRTESYARAKTLVHDLGFTVEQALQAENLDLPAPKGEILSAGKPAPGVPGPAEGSHQDGPRDPVGDNGDAKASNPGPREITIEEYMAAK